MTECQIDFTLGNEAECCAGAIRYFVVYIRPGRILERQQQARLAYEDTLRKGGFSDFKKRSQEAQCELSKAFVSQSMRDLESNPDSFEQVKQEVMIELKNAAAQQSNNEKDD